MMINLANPEVLISVPTEAESSLIVSVLEENGIRASAVGQYTSEFRVCQPGTITIIVESKNLELARMIIEKVQQQKDNDIDWSQVDVGIAEPESVSSSNAENIVDYGKGRSMEYCTDQTKGRRTKLLITICVLSALLGVFSLVQSIQGIADRLNPNTGALTERQLQTYQQTKTILEPCWPIQWSLLVMDSINGAMLIVSSFLAFRLQPTGRKFLLTALIFTIVLDGLWSIWMIGTGIATFQVTLHHLAGTMEASRGKAESLDAMRTVLIIGYIISIAIVLVKAGLEVAACKYLKSAAMHDLYRIKDKQALKLN
jgi:hypothetical protein